MKNINLEKQADEIGISLMSLLELYEIFLEQTEQDIQKLHSYIKDGDFSHVNSCAHHIKGACLNLELMAMADLAVEMQKQSEKDDSKTLISLLEGFESLFGELKTGLSGKDHG